MKRMILSILLVIGMVGCKWPGDKEEVPVNTVYTFSIEYQNGDIDTIRFICNDINYFALDHGDLVGHRDFSYSVLLSDVRKYELINTKKN